MPTTDTSKKGLESIIVTAFTGLDMDVLRIHSNVRSRSTHTTRTCSRRTWIPKYAGMTEAAGVQMMQDEDGRNT